MANMAKAKKLKEEKAREEKQNDLIMLSSAKTAKNQQKASDMPQTETRSMLRKRIGSFMAETLSIPEKDFGQSIKRLIKDRVCDKIDMIKKKLGSFNNYVPEKEHLQLNLNQIGWKRRYYRAKFGCDFNEKRPRDMFLNIFSNYILGMQWVFSYYVFNECPSWEWFYPHFFAPFSEDLARIRGLKLEFSRGEPLKPLEQLMAVMPPDSNHCLPASLASLMVENDSSLSDFYPKEFKIDLDRKRFLWEGVALLPFINEKRLKEVLKPRISQLCDKEISLNIRGAALIFMRTDNQFFDLLSDLKPKVAQKDPGPPLKEITDNQIKSAKEITSNRGNTICGKFVATSISLQESTAGIVCFEYFKPEICDPALRGRLLKGVIHPKKVLFSGGAKRFSKWRFGSFNVMRQLCNASREVFDQFSRYDCNYVNSQSRNYSNPNYEQRRNWTNSYMEEAFNNRCVGSDVFKNLPHRQSSFSRINNKVYYPNQQNNFYSYNSFSPPFGGQNFGFRPLPRGGQKNILRAPLSRRKRHSRIPHGLKYSRIGFR